jgi:hypothetical protein
VLRDEHKAAIRTGSESFLLPLLRADASVMRSSQSRELKGISLRFRNLASTALRSNGDDARVNIRRLLQFVESTPILRTEIENAPRPADVAELWEQTREARDRIAYPDDPVKELGLLHALLTDLALDNGEEFWHRCYMYAGKHDLTECITEVLNDPLVVIQVIYVR